MNVRGWWNRMMRREDDVACCPLTRTWPSLPVTLGVVVLASLLGGGAFFVSGNQRDEFPHESHAGLFPLCGGCHEGIESDDPATSYPDPQLCARCHDGEEMAKVDWKAPTKEVTNLRFTHELHFEAEPLECERCHTPPGGKRMDVARALPGNCLSCHAHEAKDHYVDADCRTCHVPLARTAFNAEQVNALPLPEDHNRANFLLDVHGEMAKAGAQRCATCHTRERCTSCHVDVEGVAEIAAIPAAPSPAFPLGKLGARYPTPPSHLGAEWFERHGKTASRQECGTCHTREDCAACHVEPLPKAAAELPRRIGAMPAAPAVRNPASSGKQAVREGLLHPVRGGMPAPLVQDTGRPRVQGPGVGLQRKQPPSHASRSFLEHHDALASAQPQNCEACHTKRFCADCHDAPVTPSFHPRNFTTQHASAAYGRRLECSTCHETRTFCRSCHIQQGMGSNARLGSGFHDAEPVWLLRHAQAARQGLESCTSCHTQRDCMQCHSEIGAFGVNPHGPNFDARRVQKRNPLICFACHVTDPLKKGTP